MPIPLLAPIAAGIIGGLVTAAGTILGRALIAAGVGVVSYTGVNAALDVFKDQFIGAVGNVSPVAAGALGVLKLDVAFSIILAAVTARLVLSGLASGTVKRWIIK